MPTSSNFGLFLTLNFFLDEHPILQLVREQYFGPQALKGVAPPIPIHPSDLGVEFLGAQIICVASTGKSGYPKIYREAG